LKAAGQVFATGVKGEVQALTTCFARISYQEAVVEA
jgi:hypothetical protein